jgi:hypothetical protein
MEQRTVTDPENSIKGDKNVSPARQKLNSAYTTGALITAGLLGAVTGSWPAFLLASGVLLLMGLYKGEIRPRSRRR